MVIGLDVGSGRGGTAAWFQRDNFGRVFGIDVATLLAAFERDRVWITENFGGPWAEFVIHFYGSLRESSLAGKIRGTVLLAIAD